MKTVFLILSLLVFPHFILSAQDNFKKFPVGNSGCYAHFFGDPGQAGLSYAFFKGFRFPGD